MVRRQSLLHQPHDPQDPRSSLSQLLPCATPPLHCPPHTSLNPLRHSAPHSLPPSHPRPDARRMAGHAGPRCDFGDSFAVECCSAVGVRSSEGFQEVEPRESGAQECRVGASCLECGVISREAGQEDEMGGSAAAEPAIFELEDREREA